MLLNVRVLFAELYAANLINQRDSILKTISLLLTCTDLRFRRPVPIRRPGVIAKDNKISWGSLATFPLQTVGPP